MVLKEGGAADLVGKEEKGKKYIQTHTGARQRVDWQENTWN